MEQEVTEPISESAAREAFYDHVVRKAEAARLKYGLYIDLETILRMLNDPDVVRYPTSVHFDAAPLQAHEFAYPKPVGFHPSDGYGLFVHPCFELQLEVLSLLIAYHIPTINYGDIAEPEHAEVFGATLMGLEVDAYYQALCELAGSIPVATV